MAESVQTRPGGPSRLDQAVPMVTELAALDERDVIHGRQPYGPCGFYHWQDTASEWRAWRCLYDSSSTTTICNTVIGYFGCLATRVPTTCFASTESARCNTLDKKQLCCLDPDYPECVVGQKTVGTEKITAYMCAYKAAEFSIYESTDFPTSASEETISTGTVSSGTVETSTSHQTSDVPTTTISDTAKQTSSTDNGSSSTPVGPIVGGVIGGLALIALVGFGIWFIRRKKQYPGAVPSHGGYHPQSQSLPHYDYVNPAYAAPQYNQPPMSSTQANESQRFSNLPYVASTQASELQSPPARPKTPEL